MKTTTKPITMLVTEDLLKTHRLDPVRIICENFEPGKGRIILVCFDSAWVGYWGAMSGKTVEEFFISCDADYLAGNMGCSGHLRAGPLHRAYLIRVITAAQEALRSRQPKPSKARTERLARIEHVNQLIKVIGTYGRRFFWNEKDQRFARIEMDARGRIWWIDDYRGARVSMENIGGYEHRWKGFSHGGTLKDLAKQMREYVKNDTAISTHYIAQDCWGYDAEAQATTKNAAADIRCVVPF